MSFVLLAILCILGAAAFFAVPFVLNIILFRRRAETIVSRLGINADNTYVNAFAPRTALNSDRAIIISFQKEELYIVTSSSRFFSPTAFHKRQYIIPYSAIESVKFGYVKTRFTLSEPVDGNTAVVIMLNENVITKLSDLKPAVSLQTSPYALEEFTEALTSRGIEVSKSKLLKEI